MSVSLAVRSCQEEQVCTPRQPSVCQATEKCLLFGLLSVIPRTGAVQSAGGSGVDRLNARAGCNPAPRQIPRAAGASAALRDDARIETVDSLRDFPSCRSLPYAREKIRRRNLVEKGIRVTSNS